jgi:hypothetical protein
LVGFSGVYVLELPSRPPAGFVGYPRALIPAGAIRTYRTHRFGSSYLAFRQPRTAPPRLCRRQGTWL